MKDTTSTQTARPPVVVVMGHIDHGKSTLLDYIRKTNIVAGEAGGITQRLSAYEVEHTTKEGVTKRVTFLDTPGHEAFQAMRSRGASVADVAILVVSAEDGVKAQTLEALKTIRESGIPFLVAINKIDKPSANVERAKQQLLENGIYLEGLGGDIAYVPISAKAGTGVEELLDMTLLTAELRELKGDPSKTAEGAVIEAHVDTKKGISATLIIKDGTLEKGSFVVAGESLAPVRIMENFLGKKITTASLGSPVRVIGFSSLPIVGSLFTTVKTKKEAEALALEVTRKNTPPPLSEEEETRTVIPVIIKADASGAIGAIEHELQKLESERIRIKVIQKGVGSVSESDVKVASGSKNSVVLGFNVGLDERARELAERDSVVIERFDIIYKLAEWFAEAIKERTPKMRTEERSGKAKVLKVFSSTKNVTLTGGRVEEGVLEEGDKIRVLRKDEEIGRGEVLSLQQGKTSKRKIESGDEFGAQLKVDTELMHGDTIEAVAVVIK